MLLRFEIENWMSFRDTAELSLVASRERQHGDRLPRIRKYRLRALPVAAIYGGNASGKSNLFKALAFAKRLVVDGTQPDAPILTKPFILDDVSRAKPTRMKFEILVGDDAYEFAFAITSEHVLEESLTKVLSSTERVLYERKRNEIHFDDSLHESDADRQQFLRFTFQTTRDNELFLTSAASQNILEFKRVWSWFRDCLTPIGPSSFFRPSEMLVDESNPLSTQVADALAALDTGIVGLDAQEVSLEEIGLINDDEIRQLVRPGRTVRIPGPRGSRDRYLVSQDDGGVVTVKRLVARHPRPDGTEVTMSLSDEADGTRRVIDLLPAFCDIGDSLSTRVYVVDELDRSLHTLLTRQLLGSFLDACSPMTRAQLVFTTHDLLLMDQDLVRRDEMWVTERDVEGRSSLMSFSEYEDVRYDKDIRKSYLQGRLGGVPRLFFRAACQPKA